MSTNSSSRAHVALNVAPEARRASSLLFLRALFLAFSFSVAAFAADKKGPPEFIRTLPGQCPIERTLLDQANAHGEVAFWVVLKDQADLRPSHQMRDWKQRGDFVYSRLNAAALRSQPALRKLLQQQGAAFQPFWILNALCVHGNRALIDELASRPDVLQINADRLYTVPGSTSPLVIVPPTSNGVQWNIDRIGAPIVWSNYGTRGEGVVVCNIDTGVQYDHPALISKYRGNQGTSFNHNYNWFDPAGTTAPFDSQGHGTHTMGTMVGDDGQGHVIGVAPGARWIAAKGCDTSSCSAASLTASAQWVLAPTDLAGGLPRPDLRPDIVNNSWGGDMYADAWFQALVQQWIAAGIFPVFAAGNEGGTCLTVFSPADYPESYSVGAFDVDNNLGYFSGTGPSFFGVGKPDITAPGVNVVSSYPTNGYAVASGTSMAAPHAAGAVALLWSAAPALKGDIETTIALLGRSAIKVSDTRCGGFATNNNIWGQGRLDISIAVSAAPRGPTGVLQGGITNSVSGAAISGALVEVAGPMATTGTTGADGKYSLPALVIGTYAVKASGYGYLDQTFTVNVDGVAPAIQNAALVPAPVSYNLSGYVYDSAGHALSGAQVRILNSTNAPAVTGADGAFSFSQVPEGNYQVAAEASCCVLPLTQLLAVTANVTGFNFSLQKVTDAFGYQCDAVAPSYIMGNTPLNLHGDDFYAPVQLPFPFVFYGRSYPTGYVSCNGFLTFSEPGATEYFNTPIPSTPLPNAAIYAFWDDLYLDSSNDVYTAVSGIPPSRQFVIEWRNAWLRDFNQKIEFEVILKESGNILVQYRNLANTPAALGGYATLGIENEDGSVGLDLSVNKPSLVSPQFAISYSRPPVANLQGHVLDANDSLPVPRAKVSISQGSQAREITTDEKGFYKTQVALGSVSLESSAYNYAAASANLALTQTNGLYIQDFALPTPRAEVLPGSVQFAMGTGQTKSLTFTITNSGTAPLDWSLGPAGGTKIAALPSVRIQSKEADPNAATTRGLYLDAAPASWPALPGDVLRSWAIAGPSLGWGIGRSTNLWISDAYAYTNATQLDVREFSEFAVPTGTNWRTLTNGAWPADMAFDSTHHLMCAATVGGIGPWSNSISCWDPATGTVVTNITGPWSTVSQRGLAYRADDDTFYIGGWLEAVPNTGITYIYHIKGLSWDVPGAILGQFRPFESGTSGLAWNPVQHILWQGCNSLLDTIYALNPTNGDVMATLSHPNPGFNGAGLETDEIGNLWVLSQKPNIAYLLDTGRMMFTNTPWLSTSVTNGTVTVGGTQIVTLDANSLGLSLGSYASDLFLQGNTGRGQILDVPVTVNTIAGTSFLTGINLKPPTSNNLDKWLGMVFTMSTNPVTVLSLGRMKLAGNTQVHTVKLVNFDNKQDVAGGTVDIDMSQGMAGQFVYANLPSPVVLRPNVAYYLVSLEFNGGDSFYGNSSGSKAVVTSSAIAGGVFAVSGSVDGSSWIILGSANECYGPVDFKHVTERVLTVTSQNAGTGLPVAVFPADIIGRSGANANFTRVYDNGTQVTLTAAKTAGYNVFQKWQKDGVDWNSNRIAGLMMGADTTMTATYGLPTLSGIVTLNGSNLLENVSLSITGDTNLTLLSAGDGSFQTKLFAGGNFNVTATKTSDTPFYNGVDIVDVVAMRRHILGLAPFTSPTALLAADVDGSNMIDINDVILMRRLILGLITEFPAGLWKFLPPEYVFLDPQSPWNPPATGVYAAVSANLTGQLFTAIKLGDVNASWSKPVAAPAAKTLAQINVVPVIELQVPNTVVVAGEAVKIPITSGGSGLLSGLQLSLTWNPELLRFKTVQDLSLPELSPSAFSFALTGQGILNLAWAVPEDSPLYDGGVLFNIIFEAIGSPGASCEVAFANSPTPCAAARSAGSARLEGIGGRITVLASRPSIYCTRDPQTGAVSISTISQDGIHYSIEYTDYNSSASWQKLASFVGDGTSKTLSDTSATNSQRFYRLRLE